MHARPGFALPARALTVLSYVGGLAVLAIWWQSNRYSSEAQGWTNGLTSVGRVAGLFAAYLALLQLILMARIPWIERNVGLPRITTWHRALGADTVLLMLAHTVLVTWGYGLRAHTNPFSQYATFVTTYPAMIRATIAGGIFLIVAITSIRWCRRKLPYEVWWLIHLTSYAAVALAVTHQLRTGQTFALRPLAQDIYVALVVAVIAVATWWRAVVPVRQSWIHRVVVDEVTRETSDTASLWLKGEAAERLRGSAGQYVIVRFLTKGHWATGHPYSLSTPLADGRMRITVRDLGDHSGSIAAIPVGTRAIIEGPFGSFTSRSAREQTPALLIGGGVGITPLRALAEELAQDARDVVVLHRGSTEEELILRDELASIGVTVHELIGSRASLGHDPLEPSRLAKLVPDVAERDVWICGPDGMTWSAIQAVRGLGVKDQHIHLEEFSL